MASFLDSKFQICKQSIVKAAVNTVPLVNTVYNAAVHTPVVNTVYNTLPLTHSLVNTVPAATTTVSK